MLEGSKRGEFSRIDGYFDLDERCKKGIRRNYRLRGLIFPFFSSFSFLLFFFILRKETLRAHAFVLR